jgi:hypothetical protein
MGVVIPFAKVKELDGKVKIMMRVAFGAAWISLSEKHHPCVEEQHASQTTELMWRRLAALAAQGVRDPRVMTTAAVNVAAAGQEWRTAEPPILGDDYFCPGA